MSHDSVCDKRETVAVLLVLSSSLNHMVQEHLSSPRQQGWNRMPTLCPFCVYVDYFMSSCRWVGPVFYQQSVLTDWVLWRTRIAVFAEPFQPKWSMEDFLVIRLISLMIRALYQCSTQEYLTYIDSRHHYGEKKSPCTCGIPSPTSNFVINLHPIEPCEYKFVPWRSWNLSFLLGHLSINDHTCRFHQRLTNT